MLYSESPWKRIVPKVTSDVTDRDKDLLDKVIKQFDVKNSPRYRRNQQGKNETYCNIFLWDVTIALNTEIPHWVDANNNATTTLKGARELNANSIVNWMKTYGVQRGWTPVKQDEALNYANKGKPVVVLWKNPKGIGHVAIVRPGKMHPTKGIPIAQAGSINFDDLYLADGFGSRKDLVFYAHE